jgi:hypothetical protein
MTNALLILFNLLYDYNYNIKNNLEYNNSKVFILFHEIADFLLLDNKTMNILTVYDNLVIDQLTWKLHTKNAISILNSLSLSSSKHDYIKNFANTICENNLKQIKLIFFTHMDTLLNNAICNCKLCQFVINNNNIIINQNKILSLIINYISKL